jgi:hypothetical protein
VQENTIKFPLLDAMASEKRYTRSLCAQTFHVKTLTDFNMYVAVDEDHAM